MNNKQFKNIIFPADTSGTFLWRRSWANTQLMCLAQNLGINNTWTTNPPTDGRYYQGTTSVTVQRWINDGQVDFVEKFLKPITEQIRGWLVYEIDDLMWDGTVLNKEKAEFLKNKYGDFIENSIPLFNRGRGAFEGEKVQTNIKKLLNYADFVTVTTDYLREIYHDLYDVPMENIIAVPNLLPRYLFDDRYDCSKKCKSFEKAKPKNKIRVGVVSSLSHYNIDNVRIDTEGRPVREEKSKDVQGNDIKKYYRKANETKEYINFEDTKPITDDFDEIIDVIKETINDFQWVMFGFCPPALERYVKEGKIEYHGGVPIMNYPSVLEKLNLNAVVAPIKKTAFNFSKSFIKYMEAAAEGYVLYATNCLPYNRVMPKDQLFDDRNDLKNKLMNLKMMSTENYKSMLERQWKWVNSPCNEGDFHLKNFWMEDNLQIWIDLFRLRQKYQTVSMKQYFENKRKVDEERQKNAIFSNNNGVEILK